MLSNTLTLTVNSVAKVLTRINQDAYASEYRLISDTESWVLKIRNTVEKSGGYTYDRHNVEVVHITFATATTPEYYWSASQTFKNRQRAGSNTELVYLVAALATLVNSNAAAIAQGES